MAHLPPTVLEHFEHNHGIASGERLRELGLTDHGLRDLRRVGTLVSVLQGVYRLPAVPLDESARCAAVCAGHPEAVISGPTAGRLWHLRRVPQDRRIHALFPPHAQPTTVGWVRPYRTAAIHADDVVQRADGIAVTSRPRTALDLCRVVPAGDALSIIEQVLHDGGLSDSDLRRVAIDWLSPQRPWVRRFLELLDRRLRGGPAESHAEVVVGDALLTAGVRGVVRQFDIDLPGYGPARFDLAVPSMNWAIEIDAFPTHRETEGRRRDRARDGAARSIGWSVTRLGPGDVGSSLPATVARLLVHYRSGRAVRVPAEGSPEFSPPRELSAGR